MTSTENSGLWQIYVFSAVFIIYSFVMYGFIGDPCMVVFGESNCNTGAETFISRAVAVGLLNVGVFFAALTYINNSHTPKLKRLSNMTTNCAMALLVSIIFLGPKSQGGLERSLFHLGDLILGIVLVAILISPTWDSTEMAPPSATLPWNGLGANAKTFLVVVGILLMLKAIVMSEFMNPLSFLNDVDSGSTLSKYLWQWLIVIIVIILYPLAFALFYGNDKDHEVIVGAIVAMIVVTVISILPMANMFKAGLMTASLVSGSVASLLGIGSIIAGRSGTNRAEYEAV